MPDGSSLVEFHHVGKRYRRGRGHGSLRDAIPLLVKRATGRASGEARNHFWAVNDVSFRVGRGEALGIIGHNGAGKSTILKLLAGVTAPTVGAARLKGRFSALIELGAGFHQDLTGRENVYLNGSILGLSRADIDRRLGSIVNFADLEKFIDTPLKRYSSGMQARLGFAVAAHVEPEILLVDEVLSVGDFAFQQKCLKKMEEFRRSGAAIVFVSHNLNAVASLCSKALLLRAGEVVASGTPMEVIDAYTSVEYTVVSGEEAEDVTDMEHGRVTHDMRIVGADICDEEGRPSRCFLAGSRAVVKVRYRAERDVVDPILGIGLRAEDGTIAYGTNTSMHELEVGPVRAGEDLVASYTLSLQLCEGRYSLNAAAVPIDGRVIMDWSENLLSFQILSDGTGSGIAELGSAMSVTRTSPTLGEPLTEVEVGSGQ